MLGLRAMFEGGRKRVKTIADAMWYTCEVQANGSPLDQSGLVTI
jgi:hypothetical protein